ncbi:MAG: hypothetical protein NVSMB45_11140 [Ginsengibacter sp.]
MDNVHKVLIIDDDPDVLETLQAVLTSRGFKIDTLLDVTLLRDRITQFKPDVILLDVTLKEAHGGEVCKELKTCGIAQKIPVILFSGDRNIKESYKVYLADDFIEKPVKINNLVSALRQANVKIQ